MVAELELLRQEEAAAAAARDTAKRALEGASDANTLFPPQTMALWEPSAKPREGLRQVQTRIREFRRFFDSSRPKFTIAGSAEELQEVDRYLELSEKSAKVSESAYLANNTNIGSYNGKVAADQLLAAEQRFRDLQDRDQNPHREDIERQRLSSLLAEAETRVAMTHRRVEESELTAKQIDHESQEVQASVGSHGGA